jgi:hypothetical protein
VRGDEAVIHELESAAAGERDASPLLQVTARVTTCGREVGASHIRVLADQRFFDWERGATGWKFRDRVIGEWSLIATGQPRG